MDNVILTRVERRRSPHHLQRAQRTRDAHGYIAEEPGTPDNLGRVLSLVGKATRYLASVNTQYNPVFGVINLIRDAQGALLELVLNAVSWRAEEGSRLHQGCVGWYLVLKDIRDHRAGKKPFELRNCLMNSRTKAVRRVIGTSMPTRNNAEAIQSELKQLRKVSAANRTRASLAGSQTTTRRWKMPSVFGVQGYERKGFEQATAAARQEHHGQL